MLHNNTDSKIKAIGCFIFGGSQTIGHLKAGWNVDRVLEMTENMKEINSAHFVKNYPDIPIILLRHFPRFHFSFIRNVDDFI